MELLEIATALFIFKCDRELLQIATFFYYKAATRFIKNWEGISKWWLLQIVTVKSNALVLVLISQSDKNCSYFLFFFLHDT